MESSETWELTRGSAAGALPWSGADPADAAPTSYWGRFGRRFLEDRLAVAAAVTLGVITLAALLAPWIGPASAPDGDVALRLAPLGSPGHLLGTDEQGRDMLTRLLHGARLTLLAGLVPVLAAGLIGGALGMIAGYFRGVVGGTIMRVMDVFYAFPAILLAIGLAAALGPGLRNAIIALAVVFIPPVVRV